MVDKRRISNLLPPVFQTETSKKFFGSIVDNLFQPGKPETLAGYIGKKPSYYDSTKDFYIPEPNDIRAAHQLEVAMTSTNDAGEISELLFYDDLINYLTANNAIVTDQNRLFADQFYSWSPPVDLDKLNNPHQYFWFGDAPNAIPTVILTSTYVTYTANGSSGTFNLPPQINGIASNREFPVVYVNTVSVDFEINSNNTALTLVKTPNAGDSVIVFRYGDLKKVIEGQATFNPASFNSQGITALTSGMKCILNDGLGLFIGFDVAPFENVTTSIDGQPALANIPWDAYDTIRDYWIDGVGNSIALTSFSLTPVNAVSYVTIDRRSADRNPWSRSNYWVHHDAFIWSGLSFPDRKASRPIIEFIPDLELYNYGSHRLDDIDAIMTGNPNYCPFVKRNISKPLSNWDIFPFETTAIDSNGFYEIPLSEASGKPLGTIFADADNVLLYGDRFLILDNDDPNINNRIATVKPIPGITNSTAVSSDFDILGNDTVAWDSISSTVIPSQGLVMIFEIGPAPVKGDVCRKAVRGLVPWDLYDLDKFPYEKSNIPLEYYFDGTTWIEAQYRIDNTTDPVFALYNQDYVRHDLIAGSTFSGNRLFGYAAGTTNTIDPILNRVVKYDNNGEIIFENDVVTKPTNISKGFQYYRVIGDTISDDQYLNGWYTSSSYTSQGMTNGVYNIPMNLTSNADNDEVTFITKNQWFDQLTGIIKNQTGFVGSAYSRNNWRDTLRDLSLAKEIIQNRSPLLKTMLLASDERFDYFDAVRYSDQEYTRFRNKFCQNVLEILRTGQRNTSDSSDLWVDTVLKNLKIAKTNDFPFALSNVGGAQNFIPQTPATLGLLQCMEPRVEIDDTYVTPITVTRGHDGSRTPLFGDIRDQILLALELRIYKNIPDRFKVENNPPFDFWNYLDGRDRQPSNGDNGSTTTVDDSCSQALPGSSTAASNNLNYDDLDVTPDMLRYANNEYIRLYTPIFIRWASNNNLNYRINNTFDNSNPFTWNFRDIKDIDGNPMPGNWRGIYLWYFDTDRPHVAPWEMLGFMDKPVWWELNYGVAPYTRGNTHMWNDIRQGKIADGPRKGYDSRFARPDLLNVLPVDDDGNLIDPIAAKIIPIGPTQPDAMRDWVVGDVGPVENLWRMTPSWRYGRAQIGCLMRPAEWIESGWDRYNITLLNNQWINAVAMNRPRSAYLTVHGELLNNGTKVSAIGIQQWISDLMVSRAQDPFILGEAVRGLESRLSHRMAGFTQSDNIRIFADNFGIIPSEDITVVYHESTPIREVVYSGVIIEWTGDGWRVIGYDSGKQQFCTIPGTTGPQTTIQLGENPIIYEWRANVAYPVNRLVEYQNSIYRCNTAHTSGQKFQTTFWTVEAINPRPFPQVTVSDVGSDDLVSVPYGTIFKTYQEVASFIRDYSRWLTAAGWEFTGVDPQTNELQNWDTAIKDFLKWAQMQWQPGNFIALSPGASTLMFKTDQGTVYNIEKESNGIYGLLDRTGHPLSRSVTFVSRLDDETKIITTTNDLFGARLRVGEIEHVIIFSNLTVFNDIIYQPLYNLRQPRLRLIGLRAAAWKGRRDAPGYVIEDNNLYPNFDKAAEDIREMYEIEDADSKDLRDHARHNVGYQTRPYLDNLLLSETQQFEFYQGAIQSKGTSTVFDRLSRSHFVDSDSTLKFLEEWAFKAGTFGAVSKFNTIGFKLTENDIRSNPQYIQFREDFDNDGVLSLPADDNRWIDRPGSENVFKYRNDPAEFSSTNGIPGGPELRRRKKFLPSAGYVRRDEVDYSILKLDYLPTLFNTVFNEGKNFDPGKRIWVYDRGDGNFNVLESFSIGSDADTRITAIETSTEDSNIITGTRIVFDLPHGLINADIGLRVLIIGQTYTQGDIQGVQILSKIENAYNIFIEANTNVGFDFSDTTIGFEPQIVILRPMRFVDIPSAQVFFRRFMPPTNQIVYVDNAGAGAWATYSFDSINWNIDRQQPKRVNTDSIGNVLLYDLNTILDKDTISPEPTIFDRFTIIDPISGNIAGAAENEITYKLEYDPAVYFENSGRRWGNNEIGTLWWNLDAVRFLDAELDILRSQNDARTQRELNYRIANWGLLAPGTSVDIYEWVGSLVHPLVYPGDVYNPVAPPYAEVTEFIEDTGKIQTVYYFWVKNRQTPPPSGIGRKLSAAQVSDLIANPRGNLPWMSPISSFGMIIGNVDQYLTDDSSVLQIKTIDETYEGTVHTEWKLLKKYNGDLPPETNMVALRDSLVGFNQYVESVPDALLPANMQTGFSFNIRKSLIANGRTGVLEARSSFIKQINTTLANINLNYTNPNAFENLTREANPFKQLIWRQDSSLTFVPPPVNSYDYEVNSLYERDQLLNSGDLRIARGFTPWELEAFDTVPYEIDFSLNALETKNPRIYVRNIDGKSWSIWEINPNSTAGGSPNDMLRIASNYDIEYDTRADLIDAINNGFITIGTRILIVEDELASNFWTVHLYDPTAINTNANGLVLLNAQTYRTSDFISNIDWYASGYSAVNPPIISYPTKEARNLAENPRPINTLVKILNDNGKWIWTEWDGTIWNTVAQQNGTIELSPLFYSSKTIVYGVNDVVIANIPTRDGSWELQILFDILRSNILTAEQVNEFFFSMLHFLHNQQEIIDWAFKTSFLSVVGFDERAQQTPIVQYDNTDNLLAYIDEVKPYRVKTRDYSRVITPDIDIANVHVTDFDKPMYFDTELGIYRRLNPNVQADAIIIQTMQPWKEWYNNYLNSDTDPTSNTFNFVRHMDIKIRFDRIDPTDEVLGANYGWDIFGFELFSFDNVWDQLSVGGSALTRMQLSYEPQLGMRQKDATTLFGLSFKGIELDGGEMYVPTSPDLSVWDITPYEFYALDDIIDVVEIDTIIDAENSATIDFNPDGDTYELIDPYHASNHPQELIPVHGTDVIALNVTTDWSLGAPGQYTTYRKIYARDGNTTILFNHIPDTIASIIVYFDGVKVTSGTDYTIDYLNKSITTVFGGAVPQTVFVHIFTSAGLTRFLKQVLYIGDGTTVSFNTLVPGEVEVIINGVIVDTSAYTIVGMNVVFTVAPTNNAYILINIREFNTSWDIDTFETDVFEASYILDSSTHVIKNTVSYNAGQTWTLTNRTLPVPIGK